MSVTRYKVEELECCFQADMIESPTGEYVLHSDYARLKAEVASLKSLCDNLGMGGKHTVTATVEEYEKLKAELERLRKAGDAMACHLVCSDLPNDVCGDLMKKWNAAKEGKQS